MSVYNSERYLRAAVESVLAQTFREFEFLIVDDGSTDDSPAILRSFRDPRLRLVRNETNRGLTSSLNRGLELARGQFIARMDADDVSHAERLAKQMAFLARRSEVGVVGTAYTNIDSDGSPLFVSSFSGEHGFLLWYLFFQNPIAHPSVLMRADLVRKVHGYRQEIRYGQDHDLWWRLALLTRLSNLREPLLDLRHHAHSITSRHTHEQQALCARVQNEMMPHVLGRERAEAFQTKVEAEESVLARRQRFIVELLQAYTASAKLTEAERVLVHRDAAFRLAVLALQHLGHGRTTRILAAAHKLDPLVGFRIAAWPLRRYLFRRVSDCVLRK